MENRYGEITQNEIQENKQTNKKGSIGTMGHSMEDSQKIKDRTTTWSSNSTSGNISKGNENTNSKRCLHPHVHSIIYSSQDMEIT